MLFTISIFNRIVRFVIKQFKKYIFLIDFDLGGYLVPLQPLGDAPDGKKL